jgi:hypothetical protein
VGLGVRRGRRRGGAGNSRVRELGRREDGGV